jgi:hypothetical protein
MADAAHSNRSPTTRIRIDCRPRASKSIAGHASEPVADRLRTESIADHAHSDRSPTTRIELIADHAHRSPTGWTSGRALAMRE